MIARMIILSIAGATIVADASAQSSGRSSHKVTVERVAETRVTGPVSVPVRPQNLLEDAGLLEINSNVSLLKVVYSLVEPEGGISQLKTDTEPSLLDMRQVYSSQEMVHPTTVRHIDLKRVVSDLPPDLPEEGIPFRRLVVTITE